VVFSFSFRLGCGLSPFGGVLRAYRFGSVVRYPVCTRLFNTLSLSFCRGLDCVLSAWDFFVTRLLAAFSRPLLAHYFWLCDLLLFVIKRTLLSGSVFVSRSARGCSLHPLRSRSVTIRSRSVTVSMNTTLSIFIFLSPGPARGRGSCPNSGLPCARDAGTWALGTYHVCGLLALSPGHRHTTVVRGM
jgi:hypothetical protein